MSWSMEVNVVLYTYMTMIQRKQKKKKKSFAQVLIDIGRRAEKENWRAPRDLSTNHDKYFIEAWEEEHPYMCRKKV